MNCYAGLVKRIVKSCFPQVVPVPQLEPLDASKISKQEACVALSDISQKKLMNQQTYWTHECLFNPKPLTDEEAWEATLAWAEAKAQERETAALKAVSETDTDESYDCDEDDFGNFDGNVYEGEWNAAEQREGHGKYVWPSGAVYEGEWKADKMEGFGKYVWTNSDVYEGEWKAGHREGRGTELTDGGVYEGEWKTGYREGCGIYWFANGDVYEGEFKADKREGRGILRSVNGDVYDGEWKGGKKEGRGKYVFTDDEDSSGDEDASGSEDDEEFPLAAMAGLMRQGTMFEEKKAWNISDAAAAAAMWRDDAQAAAYESVAVSKAIEALDKQFPSPRKYKAATIIQAAARGRAVRVWKAKFTHGLAVELTHIHRMRYLKRDSADWSWWFEALMLENAASPKCAIAWIKLAEQRRYSHYF